MQCIEHGHPRPLLRTPGVRPLLLGEVISTSGAQLGFVALPWLVLTTTGSPAKMGWVMAAALAPVALFGPHGGVLAARLGPRTWMIMSDLVRAVLVGLIPLLHLAGALPLPLLLTLVFAAGFFQAPYLASQQTILTGLVGEDEETLGRASSMLQSAVRTTLLIGPPAAAGLIAFSGAPAVLVLSAVSYLAAALVILRGVRRAPPPPSPSRPPSLGDGFRTLLGDRLLLFWTLGTVITEAAWQALFAAIPLLAFTRFGGDVQVVGITIGAFGAGALTGALLAVPVLRHVPAISLANAGKLAQALAFALLLFPLDRTGLAASLLLAGLFNGLTIGPANAVRLIRIPAAVRSQTLTLMSSVTVIGGTAGLVAGGLALSAAGEAATLGCLVAAQLSGFALFALGSVGMTKART